MPHIVIDIDTSGPIQPTSWVDALVFAALPMVEGTLLLCLAAGYYMAFGNPRYSFTVANSNALMCIGAGVHILSTFISNGHMVSVGWIDSLRHVHCTVWDFWGKFFFGFTLWYLGLIAHQLNWIATLYKPPDSRSASQTADSGQANVTPVNVVISGSSRSPHLTWYQRVARRQRIAAGVIIVVVISIILVVMDLTDATQYVPSRGMCLTKLGPKIVIVVWLFLSLLALLGMLDVIRRGTRHTQTISHQSGLAASIQTVVVCSVTFVALAVLNASGLLIYSVPRSLETCALMGMYLFSVLRMFYETLPLDEVKATCMQRAEDITFQQVWADARLRTHMLDWIRSCRWQLVCKVVYDGACDAVIDVESWHDDTTRLAFIRAYECAAKHGMMIPVPMSMAMQIGEINAKQMSSDFVIQDSEDEAWDDDMAEDEPPSAGEYVPLSTTASALPRPQGPAESSHIRKPSPPAPTMQERPRRKAIDNEQLVSFFVSVGKLRRDHNTTSIFGNPHTELLAEQVVHIAKTYFRFPESDDETYEPSAEQSAAQRACETPTPHDPAMRSEGSIGEEGEDNDDGDGITVTVDAMVRQSATESSMKMISIEDAHREHLLPIDLMYHSMMVSEVDECADPDGARSQLRICKKLISVAHEAARLLIQHHFFPHYVLETDVRQRYEHLLLNMQNCMDQL